MVPSPSWTINVVERPEGDNFYGGIGEAVCWGPAGPSGYGIAGCQTGDNPSFPDPNNYGVAVYKQEGNRFNYLFFDGHVSRLTMQQTVGTGTTNVPRGMWMLNPNNPYY